MAHFFLFFLYTESRLVEELIHRHIQQGRRQEGWEREEKTVGNRDVRRSVEGRGMGRGTRDIQDGHYRDFQDLTRQGLSGRKARNLKEVTLGWISGGRNDHGFGWRKIKGGGEQLF